MPNPRRSRPRPGSDGGLPRSCCATRAARRGRRERSSARCGEVELVGSLEAKIARRPGRPVQERCPSSPPSVLTISTRARARRACSSACSIASPRARQRQAATPPLLRNHQASERELVAERLELGIASVARVTLSSAGVLSANERRNGARCERAARSGSPRATAPRPPGERGLRAGRSPPLSRATPSPSGRRELAVVGGEERLRPLQERDRCGASAAERLLGSETRRWPRAGRARRPEAEPLAQETRAPRWKPTRSAPRFLVVEPRARRSRGGRGLSDLWVSPRRRLRGSVRAGKRNRPPPHGRRPERDAVIQLEHAPPVRKGSLPPAPAGGLYPAGNSGRLTWPAQATA